MFQSLFCWMLFWKNKPVSVLVYIIIVSILILLDAVLEDLQLHLIHIHF